MPCDISLGRAEQCKNSIGGLRAAYFINWGDATTVTYSATAGQEDVITALGGTPVGYKYELKGTSTFEQTVTSSRENGTTFVDQKLSLSIKKLTLRIDHIWCACNLLSHTDFQLFTLETLDLLGYPRWLF